VADAVRSFMIISPRGRVWGRERERE